MGYRDSRVTRLLQESLGGNSATTIFTVVSPAGTVITNFHGQSCVNFCRIEKLSRHSSNSFMAWQIPKQLCNNPTVSRELTLLRESTPKGNESSLIEHYAMSLNE